MLDIQHLPRRLTGFEAALLALCFLVFLATAPGYSRDSALDHFNRARKLIRENDLKAAQQELEEAYDLDDEDPDIRRYLSLVSNNLAVRMVDAGNYEEALPYYEKSLEIEPEDDIVRMNYARCLSSNERPYDAILVFDDLTESDNPETVQKARWKLADTYFSLREFERASDELEEVVFTDEKDTRAHLLLARCYIQTGDKDKAVEHIRLVSKISTSSKLKKTAAKLLKRISREAKIEEEFQFQKSSHFSIVVDEERGEDLLDIVLTFCEEAYVEVGERLKYYPDRKTTVIIYKPVEFTTIYPDSNWAAGLYHEWTIKIPIPAGELTRENHFALRNTIFHEYSHLLVNALTGGNCPRWFDEGIAESMESKKNWDKQVELLLKMSRVKMIPSLKKIDKNFTSKDLNQITIGYTVARHAVRFIDEEWGIYRIQRILEEIRDDGDINSAFQDVLGYDLERFMPRWYQYLERQHQQIQAREKEPPADISTQAPIPVQTPGRAEKRPLPPLPGVGIFKKLQENLRIEEAKQDAQNTGP